MGWETRKPGSTRYYTRTHRLRVSEGGGYLREYVGTGARAEAIAERDAQARERRAQRQADTQRERARYAQADAMLAAYYASVEAQVRSALTAAGYQQHKRGEWRRQRGSTSHHP